MLRSAFRIRLAQESDLATFIVFDILEYNGKDLTGLPLVKRKEKLKSFKESETAVCSRVYLYEGEKLYAWTQRQDVYKRQESRRCTLRKNQHSARPIKAPVSTPVIMETGTGSSEAAVIFPPCAKVRKLENNTMTNTSSAEAPAMIICGMD